MLPGAAKTRVPGCLGSLRIENPPEEVPPSLVDVMRELLAELTAGRQRD
jgi:hypothetical protein